MATLYKYEKSLLLREAIIYIDALNIKMSSLVGTFQ